MRVPPTLAFFGVFGGYYGWLRYGFGEQGFDWEWGEELFGFGHLSYGFGAVSSKETGVGVLGDAGAGDQIAASK